MDRPVIFSAPMVCALLDGRKTQTRRLATSPLAKSQPGDRLWVRETIELQGAYTDGVRVIYEASRRAGSEAIGMCRRPPGATVHVRPGRLSPSIHMPRWASRLTLVVTDVRRQPLQDITEADAVAEGATSRPRRSNRIHDGWCMDWSRVGQPDRYGTNGVLTEADVCLGSARSAFVAFINRLHGGPNWNLRSEPPLWDTNPDVVALTFAVHRCNIDRLAQAPESCLHCIDETDCDHVRICSACEETAPAL